MLKERGAIAEMNLLVESETETLSECISKGAAPTGVRCGNECYGVLLFSLVASAQQASSEDLSVLTTGQSAWACRLRGTSLQM